MPFFVIGNCASTVVTIFLVFLLQREEMCYNKLLMLQKVWRMI